MGIQKTILITGVTRGLGRGLLDAFSTYGHIVIGCARSHDEITEIRKRHPHPHLFETIDVSSWESVLSFSEKIEAGKRRIDIIINNAGVINKNAPLWKVPDEEFRKIMDINVGGAVNIIRAFLPFMIREGKGIIANMSSGWGRSAAPEVAPYCASKWAIEGLTKALSQELPEGLAAVAVNPGVINTDMLKSCWGHSANDAISPSEWAMKAVRFFLALTSFDNGKSLSIR